VGAGVASVGVETIIGWFFLGHRLADIVLVYVLGVVAMAVRFGYAASLVATALSVAALDFFFTEPYFSFAVDDRRHVLTLVILGIVAYAISNQTEKMRRGAALQLGLATERAELAEAAQRAQLEVQNERLRNALLSSVSHDLRTPLAVIKGLATALLDGEDRLAPSQRRQSLQTICDEASRLNRFLQNLLRMTSLEAGRIRVQKQWQPLEEVIGTALNRLEDQLRRRPVAVRIQADAALVPFDATLIEHVFINLVENALKYTPADSPIEIGARATPEGVEIEVADLGPGVAKGEEERIFEKFYRASSTGLGVGVGLTVCKGIIVAHGGRIWCTNRPEGGSSFRFVLPYEPSEVPALRPLPELTSET
jgi:K+-sensing histidine kinase KdpD